MLNKKSMQRKSDIPELANHFIQHFNNLFGMDVKGISDPAMQKMMQNHWSGNIRELEHAIESAFNMMDGGQDLIQEYHLPAYVFQTKKEEISLASPADFSQEIDLPKMLEELERDAIMTMLDKCQGNVSKTAEALGLRRQALQYKLDKYNIQRVFIQKNKVEPSSDYI